MVVNQMNERLKREKQGIVSLTLTGRHSLRTTWLDGMIGIQYAVPHSASGTISLVYVRDVVMVHMSKIACHIMLEAGDYK